MLPNAKSVLSKTVTTMGCPGDPSPGAASPKLPELLPEPLLPEPLVPEPDPPEALLAPELLDCMLPSGLLLLLDDVPQAAPTIKTQRKTQRPTEVRMGAVRWVASWLPDGASHRRLVGNESHSEKVRAIVGAFGDGSHHWSAERGH
jgi:hypothetical protein